MDTKKIAINSFAISIIASFLIILFSIILIPTSAQTKIFSIIKYFLATIFVLGQILTMIFSIILIKNKEHRVVGIIYLITSTLIITIYLFASIAVLSGIAMRGG